MDNYGTTNYISAQKHPMLARGTPWKNIVTLKHFNVKMQTLSAKTAFKAVTPLFHLALLTSFYPKKMRMSRGQVALILSYCLPQPATSSKVTNTLRMAVFQTLNQFAPTFGPNSCVRINFLPTSRIVQAAQVQEQLRSVINQRLKSRSGDIKQQNKKGSKGDFDMKKILFPFNLSMWLDALKSERILQNFANFLYQSKGAGCSGNARPHWIVSHHYKLQGTKDAILLVQDMKMLLSVLNKFNFVTFLDNYRIHSSSRTKYKALCTKLIRNFEWCHNQTEQYLIYLVTSFGPENLMLILTDFQEVALSFGAPALAPSSTDP